jgi:hypothetical protein
VGIGGGRQRQEREAILRGETAGIHRIRRWLGAA